MEKYKSKYSENCPEGCRFNKTQGKCTHVDTDSQGRKTDSGKTCDCGPGKIEDRDKGCSIMPKKESVEEDFILIQQSDSMKANKILNKLNVDYMIDDNYSKDQSKIEFFDDGSDIIKGRTALTRANIMIEKKLKKESYKPYKSHFSEDVVELPSDEEIEGIDLSPVNKALSAATGINVKLKITRITTKGPKKHVEIEDPRNLASESGIFKAAFSEVKIRNFNSSVFKGDDENYHWWMTINIRYEELSGGSNGVNIGKRSTAIYHFNTKEWEIEL